MFKENNTGTYNSQWIIIDYNRFKGFLIGKNDFTKIIYVLEQTPGSIVSHDLSTYLEDKGYYASFNRAFFSETKESLNQQLLNNLYGDAFDYEGGVRKEIFKRLDGNVNTFEDVQKVLRYNGYGKEGTMGDKADFYDPSHGISSRFDLSDMKVLSGGIDTKVTNWERITRNTAMTISGPTVDGDKLSIFKWKDFPNIDMAHEGVPDAFDFDWKEIGPDFLELVK